MMRTNENVIKLNAIETLALNGETLRTWAKGMITKKRIVGLALVVVTTAAACGAAGYSLHQLHQAIPDMSFIGRIAL